MRRICAIRRKPVRARRIALFPVLFLAADPEQSAQQGKHPRRTPYGACCCLNGRGGCLCRLAGACAAGAAAEQLQKRVQNVHSRPPLCAIDSAMALLPAGTGPSRAVALLYHSANVDAMQKSFQKTQKNTCIFKKLVL